MNLNPILKSNIAVIIMIVLYKNLFIQKIVLVAGDSFAARLDEKLLGKNKQVVKNITVGGSKLDKVKRDIDKFVKDNPNLEVVKLFVSVALVLIIYGTVIME